MKKVMLLFIFGILLLGSVSAFEFDNWGTYNEETKTMTITNAFKLGDDIANVTLDTPLVNYVMPGKNRLVAEFTINNFKEDYNRPIKEMEFYDKNNQDSRMGREFIYKYQEKTGEKIIRSYYKDCFKVINSTCPLKEQQRVEDVYEWFEFESLEELPKGEITIGIFTDVYVGDNVEWIPTLFGERITEWAVWTDGLNVDLISYYAFENNTDLVNSTYNLTAQDSQIIFDDGLIGKAGNCSLNQSMFIDGTDTQQNWGFNETVNTTLNYWMRVNQTGKTAVPLIKRTGPNGWYIQTTAGTITFNIFGLVPLTTTEPPAQVWKMFTLVKNQTETLLYSNATLIANVTNNANSGLAVDVSLCDGSGIGDPNLVGQIDEMGIWNRSLTQLEITQLYNEGIGITYTANPAGPAGSVVTTLNAPTDNSIISNSTIEFNSTIVVDSVNATNATIFVWYSNNSLFNQTTNIITGNTTNTTIWTINNFTSDVYHWNVLGCGLNFSSASVCNYATNNFSFTWRPFTIDEQGFNSDTFETRAETFQLNITTLANILSVTSKLNYNSTDYDAQTSCDSGDCEIISGFDIPLLPNGSGESQNRSFFWKITVFDGSNSFEFNTSTQTQQQNVSRIHLEQCNATWINNTLNFTVSDEINQSRIIPFKIDSTLSSWLGNGTVKRNTSLINTSAEEIDFCIHPATENFLVSGQVEYNDEDNITYTQRNYFFQSNSINKTRQDISLFLLESIKASTFILKVQDQTLLAVQDVLIFTERFYPGENVFKVVQVARTDDNGQSVGFFQTETVDYRFIITEDNTELIRTPERKIVGETVPFTLLFIIGGDLGTPWAGFEDIPNFNSTLVFNKSNNLITYTYVDESDSFLEGRLLVVRQNQSSSSSTICNTTSALASAIITCDVATLTGNNSGSYVASSFVRRTGGESIIDNLPFMIATFSLIAGNLGLILGWFIILISAFAFKFNEIAGIAMVNFTVIFVNLIGLISFGPVFITGMIGVSILIVGLMNR